MALNEFALIQRYFNSQAAVSRPGFEVLLGNGDDATVVRSSENLVMSIDTSISGVHFPTNTTPADIAWKALAVNLSDIAAMGAQPQGFLLALTLPEVDEDWLQAFSASLARLARCYGAQLLGGDTTRGPLSITIQITGSSTQAPLRRDAARLGDDIYVSGRLGDAALGLSLLEGCIADVDSELAEYCIEQLNRPEPRVELGLELAGLAHACIDLSDGLQADLGHILAASRCGARIQQDSLPVNDWIAARKRYDLALHGGDDYELCFTAARAQRNIIDELAQRLALPLTRIGQITAAGYYIESAGQSIELQATQGYQHFG